MWIFRETDTSEARVSGASDEAFKTGIRRHRWHYASVQRLYVKWLGRRVLGGPLEVAYYLWVNHFWLLMGFMRFQTNRKGLVRTGCMNVFHLHYGRLSVLVGWILSLVAWPLQLLLSFSFQLSIQVIAGDLFLFSQSFYDLGTHSLIQAEIPNSHGSLSLLMWQPLSFLLLFMISYLLW